MRRKSFKDVMSNYQKYPNNNFVTLGILLNWLTPYDRYIQINREKTMQAMTLNSYGEDATFQPSELPTPEAGTGQVLVKIAATSINTVDTMIRVMGQENLPFAPDLPAVLGMDFAGTVEAIGDDVTDYAVGDEVYGCAGGLADLQGALAEYMLADIRLIAKKAKNLSMREAAALPLVAITAYEGLQRAGVTAGQRVLVHGGAGGVGHVALQLARYFGADVYATGSKDKQLALIEKMGATAINYRDESVDDYVANHTGGSGFDVVYDTVGAENLTNSFAATKLNGHVATTVSLLELDLSPVHFSGLSLHVVFMLIPMIHDTGREAHGNMLSELSSIIEAGHLTPLLDDKRYSLAEVGDAYARLSSGEATGKVVVDVQ